MDTNVVVEAGVESGLFSNVPKFVWYIVCVILGVILGVVGIHVYHRRKAIKEAVQQRAVMTMDKLRAMRNNEVTE